MKTPQHSYSQGEVIHRRGYGPRYRGVIISYLPRMKLYKVYWFPDNQIAYRHEASIEKVGGQE